MGYYRTIVNGFEHQTYNIVLAIERHPASIAPIFCFVVEARVGKNKHTQVVFAQTNHFDCIDLYGLGYCTFRQRNLDGRAVCESEICVLLVPSDALEEAVAIRTILAVLAVGAIGTIRAIFTILAVLAGGFAQLFPSCTIVVGNPPIALADFELRSDAILAILTIGTILAIFAVFAIATICAICTILTVFTIGTYGLDFVATLVEQPLAIEGPIVNIVAILGNANLGSIAILAIFTIGAICTILAVGTIGAILAIVAVVDGDRLRLGEGNGVAHNLVALFDGGNRGNGVVVLQSRHKGLKCLDVGVHLLASLLQILYTTIQVVIEVFEFVDSIPNAAVVELCTAPK